MSRDLALWLLVAACIALAGLVIGLAIRQIVQCRQRFLCEHSKAIRALPGINARYEGYFYDYQDSFSYRVKLDSKQKFDRFDAQAHLATVVREMLPTWEELVSRASSNDCCYTQYCQECDDLIKHSPTPKQVPWYLISRKRYRRFEWAEFHSAMLAPKHRLDVRVSWSYTSPAGRNSYADSETFDLADVSCQVEFTHERLAYEQSARYQRSLITNSVRFEVFRRDGYRCQICGRTRGDGAKLVVDHIVPVAKGGTSDMDNLQTLCFECNSGKSDRFM